MHAVLRDRGWIMKHMKTKRLMLGDLPGVPAAGHAGTLAFQLQIDPSQRS